MTTNDYAAAWRLKGSRPLVLAAVLTSFSLAGCETTASLFPMADSGASTAMQAPQAPQAAAKAVLAIAPVIGAPEPIASQFKSQLASALQTKGIVAATASGATAPYTLRGYIVSAREPAGTKVSYIWDVTTPDGKRVKRVSGEELAAGAPASRDPWQAVSPQIIATVSSKTANEIATWLPSQGSVQPTAALASAAGPVTNAVSTAGARAAGAANRTTAVANSISRGAATTTGSIGQSPPGRVTAVVPSVVGAPGDGGTALANALRRELQRKGVALSPVTNPSSYRVQGKVKLGPPTGGKQSIAIDWNVKEPGGRDLGTVSQKNEIPAGSLNGAWGQTADAAAAAAAHGIAELLTPKRTAQR